MFLEPSNGTQGLKVPLVEVNIKTIARRKGSCFAAVWLSIVIFPWWLKRQRICLQCGRPRFNPWVGKIPWRRPWQPTPVFFLGELHGQRSLVGYSPRGRKEPESWVTDTFLLDCAQPVKGRGSPVWKSLGSSWGHCWFYCNSTLPEAY